MKKTLLILTFSMFASLMFSQTKMVSGGFSLKTFSAGGFTSTAFGGGIGLDFKAGDNLTAGGNIDYLSNSGSSSFYIEPNIKYFFGEVLRGLYIGSDVGYAAGDFNFFNIGARVGYIHPITENIVIDATPSFSYFLPSVGTGGISIGGRIRAGFNF